MSCKKYIPPPTYAQLSILPPHAKIKHMPDPAQNPNQITQTTITNPVPAQADPATESGNDIQTPPVISGHREQGPMITSASESSEPPAPENPEPEILQSPPQEIKIPHELKEVVQESPDENKIKIDKEVALVGVKPAAESSPVITTPAGSIKLPMTYPQARQKAKTAKLMDSAHWLAEQIMYEWVKYEPDLVKDQKRLKTTT